MMKNDMVWYTDGEIENGEEMEMITNPVELIKAELCSRYGINPEQIVVSVEIDNVESVELADQIKNDYAIEEKALTFLNSYKGYNLKMPEINVQHYRTSADHGSHARKENILNLSISCRNGVLKNE
jgi:hypothetical protein